MTSALFFNMQKDVSIQIEKEQVETGENLNCVVRINYSGRFDSVVINSQIENSSDVFKYINLNGKKIIHPYARLSLLKQDIPDVRKVEFTVTTLHVPSNDNSNAKFRVSIIQEHKEITSDIAYLKILKKTNLA
ncbi:MAG: hypothetical protein M3530_05435 [Thermoproteota archaeon]|nr:hypothetical protein [Thermoproteota archaeon]